MSTARHRYRAFVQKGIAQGQRDDLVGGGLIRSIGKWGAVTALRKANALQKGDERILGDGDFVQSVLLEDEEAYERKYRFKAKGIDLNYIAGRAAEIIGIDPNLFWSKGKQPRLVQALSLLCYWATKELGVSQSASGQMLELSPSAVSLSVVRVGELVSAHKNTMGN